jgi:hypothetical protein
MVISFTQDWSTGLGPVLCGLGPVLCGLGPVLCGLGPVLCGLGPDQSCVDLDQSCVDLDQSCVDLDQSCVDLDQSCVTSTTAASNDKLRARVDCMRICAHDLSNTKTEHIACTCAWERDVGLPFACDEKQIPQRLEHQPSVKIHRYECMFLCMYACVCLCMYLCMYAMYVYALSFVKTHFLAENMHKCITYVCMYVRTYVRMLPRYQGTPGQTYTTASLRPGQIFDNTSIRTCLCLWYFLLSI